MVDAGGRTINEQQLAELNSELILARSNTAQASARLDRVQAVLTSNSLDATVDATVTDTLKDDVITKLRSQYLELAQRQAEWAAKYGVNHLAVVNLRNQMAEIQNSIRNELQRIAETYKSDWEVAKQHEDSVQKQLDYAVSQSQTTNQAQVSLRELQANAQSLQALYDNFLQRYMESVQQQSFPITEARVISAAVRPLHPSNPRTLLLLAGATIVCLALEIAGGAWREISDRVFRTRSQVEEIVQVECVALIPAVRGPDEEEGVAESQTVRKTSDGPADKFSAAAVLTKIITLGREGKDRGLHLLNKISDHGHAHRSAERAVARPPLRPVRLTEPGEQKIAPVDGVYSTVLDLPFSAFTEAIRSVKISIDLTPTAAGGKIIGFHLVGSERGQIKHRSRSSQIDRRNRRKNASHRLRSEKPVTVASAGAESHRRTG